ncbi:MAG TPA: sigma-70 family RNA polymerase sigma factor, partial [Acidobacteriota bacterium]|nr:sigma-70 family RNA polymerase sigma factor [Acidobacteriota bacterium]
MENTNIHNLVDHLFRQKSGQITAILVKIFGFEHIDLAQDVVQDVLIKAIQQWPFSGVPQNPGGWLLNAAKNRAIDILRREKLFKEKQPEILRQINQNMDHPEQNLFEDEQLTLMFTCCHPQLSQEIQTALILKTLCGFSVDEIGRAFLTQPATIAQRLVRAKRKIKEENIRFEIPHDKELSTRLITVLHVLYLLFNEGYSATEGEDLVRQDLCEEAVRLGSLLAAHPAGNYPETHALLALMLFHASRFQTRTDSDGNLMVLSEQDRTRWDRKLMNRALYHLDRAASGQKLSEYHIEASIAAYHATAPNYESTDWKAILGFYDMLISMNRSPVLLLNRAVALCMVEGVESGLKELDQLKDLPSLKEYYLLPASY